MVGSDHLQLPALLSGPNEKVSSLPEQVDECISSVRLDTNAGILRTDGDVGY
jgi:hypothetical protein